MSHDLLQILQDQFGLQDFRGGQKEVIEHLLAGSNTMVFMPTGG